MKKWIIVVIVILIFLLVINKYPNSLEQAMKEANIHANQILHEVTCDKGIVVFYEPVIYPNGCNVGLVEKRVFGYKWVFGGGVSYFNDKKELTWGYTNVGKSSERGSKDAFPIVHGTITNSDIQEVKVRLKDNEYKNAIIVETQLGRLWYLFLEEQINYTPEVIGIDDSGEIMYSIGF